MKVEGIIFSIYAVFLGVAGTVYWILIDEKTETAGVAALLVSMGLGVLIGGYLLGNFSPRSAWPFFIAASLAVSVVGMLIGWWLFAIGFILVFYTAVGLVFEQYRNRFSPEDS